MSKQLGLLIIAIAVIPLGAISAAEPIVVEVAPAPTPPEEARDRTYFLVVNGIDPLFVGKLNCYCEAIRCAGYKNVELYMLRQGWGTEEQICRIRKCDPGAKIVLIGYSVGANRVNKVCHSLDCKRVFVDLLVYIGADYINDKDFAMPKNAGQVVNITGHGFIGTGGDLLFKGAELTGASNYCLDARHFHLPKQPETLGIVLQHVAELHVAKKSSTTK